LGFCFAASPGLYTATVPTHELISLLILGLVAGALGGMLGIGGSIIMIPVLTLLLRQNLHLSQAVAMIVNVFVSLPAVLQHHRARAVRWDVFWRMLPFGVVLIIVGVESSNRIDAELLERIFGVFLIYVIAMNISEIVSKEPEPPREAQRVNWLTVGGTGAITGFVAGLLGVGGGIVAVPLLQRVCRLPLRQCIATTAAFMCISASIGAIRKNITLAMLTDASGESLGLDPWDSVMIAAALAPTAVIGGLFGGRLTHILPLNVVRAAFILLMAWASANMLDLM
jgi:uncharacterized membrane protein YfcA